MKYEYITVTGKQVIEVDERFHGILVRFDQDEYNSDRKHSRRHPVSLENADFEGDWFSDSADFLGELIRLEDHRRLRATLRNLTPEQQHLIQKIYFEEIVTSEYARREGVANHVVSHRLERAQKRIVKIMSETDNFPNSRGYTVRAQKLPSGRTDTP